MDHEAHNESLEHDAAHEEEARQMLEILRPHIGDGPLLGLLQQCEATYSTLMAMDAALDGLRPRIEEPAIIGILTPLHEQLIETLHSAVVFSNAIGVLQEEREAGRES